METIERIKAILTKYISRTDGPCVHNRDFMCLHTDQAIVEISRQFPSLLISDVFRIIADEVHIKQGTYTDFVFGQTSAARKINKLLKQGK